MGKRFDLRRTGSFFDVLRLTGERDDRRWEVVPGCQGLDFLQARSEITYLEESSGNR
jgi:hypothetical protein